jgi:biopolymer transport protein ExbD
MKLDTGYEQKKSRIEIVPLIDVVFLLLAAFIYGTLSMTVFSGVKVELPKVAGEFEKDQQIVITIAADNKVSIKGEVLSVESAVERAVLAVKDSKKSVIIRGDRAADLGIAVDVLGRLRRTGVTSVSFQVEEKK